MPDSHFSQTQNAKRTSSIARRFAFRAALFVFALLLGWLLLELALWGLMGRKLSEMREELLSRKRMAEELMRAKPGEEVWHTTRHPYYGFTLTPHWEGVMTLAAPTRFSVDQYGFRNGRRDFRAIPPEDTVIGIFGGSAAFGDGIMGEENTIAGRLEGKLREKYGDRVHVFNFAVGGWHEPQQYYAMSRNLPWLDVVVGVDGFNELIVPYWNCVEAGEKAVPPDYPLFFVYWGLHGKDSMDRTFQELAFMQYLAGYRSNFPFSRSAFHILARFGATQKRRLRMETEKDVAPISPASREGWIPESLEGGEADFERYLRIGAEDWARHKTMTDAVVAAQGKKVWHIVQPFQFAAPNSVVDPAMPLSEGWPRLLMRARHPSEWYGILREKARERYPLSDSLPPGVHFADLSEILPAGGDNWIDMIHPTQRGVEALAQRMFEIMVEERMLENGASGLSR
jgi:hypothetical protein